MKGQKVKKMDLLNRNEQLEVEARENLYKAHQAGIKVLNKCVYILKVRVLSNSDNCQIILPD